MALPDSIKQRILARDRHRCSYCLTAEANCGLSMHFDHIIPEVVGGPTVEDNLCLACFSCNVHKWARETGIDPQTGETIPLFHPLNQTWPEHFTWSRDGTRILGLTPCGRATVEVLQMNNPTIMCARRRWVSAGWHPPEI